MCKKLRRVPAVSLTDGKIWEIARDLFPQGALQRWDYPRVEEKTVTIFSLEELREAEKKIKPKKAPGPNNISAKIVKRIVHLNPEICLKVINKHYIKGEFPKQWKEARLILIEKPNKSFADKVTYRPICLINTFGKLYEQMMSARLEKELNLKGELAETQFGFRRGRSTMDAMERVKEFAKFSNSGACKSRELCVLITLDVKNAFNSTPWNGIVDQLNAREITPHTVKTIMSYLSECEIVYGQWKTFMMTKGVPQGSILGPLLWNIYYYEILNIKMPTGVLVLGYADDLAIVAGARLSRSWKI